MTLRLALQALSFQSLPRQNELFLHYIKRAPRIAPFYARPPEIESLKQTALHDIQGFDFPRSRMARILRRQNAAWGNDQAAFDRIDELERPGSAAILTGQQVGLFAGPLYTVYKAMTALRLAEELRRLGTVAVPIFWMDAEDHDLAEVTHLAALDRAGTLHTIDCREPLFGSGAESSRAVGSMQLPEAIRDVTSEFLSLLAPSPWEDQIRGLLECTYQPGSSLSQAFAELMARLFRSKGLVLFDPRDPEAKSIMAPIFRRAILENDRIHAALAERSQVLEGAGFHPQVVVQENATVLFLEGQSGRRALARQGSGFALKNTDSVYQPEELLALVDNEPERFSPNVLLRPVVQDHLFPTVAYVGGPAEVSYFAQIETLYRLFGRPMPVIWPRSSMTVLGEEVLSVMKEHDLSFRDCTEERSRLLQRLARTGSRRDSIEGVASLREEINHTLDGIRPGVTGIDPTLGPALDSARRKILRNVARIESRIARLGEKADRRDKHVDFLLNNCMPNGKLQERELTVHHLLAQAGLPILEEIYRTLRVEEPLHLVIWVSEQGS